MLLLVVVGVAEPDTHATRATDAARCCLHAC